MWRGPETHWSHLEQRQSDQEVWRGDWTYWSHLEQKAERPGGVERRLDSLVALRTKGRATRRCGEEIGLTGRT